MGDTVRHGRPAGRGPPRAFQPGGVTGDPVMRAAVQRVDEAPRDPVTGLAAGLAGGVARRAAD